MQCGHAAWSRGIEHERAAYMYCRLVHTAGAQTLVSIFVNIDIHIDIDNDMRIGMDMNIVKWIS
jgi:hypothetical protein